MIFPSGHILLASRQSRVVAVVLLLFSVTVVGQVGSSSIATAWTPSLPQAAVSIFGGMGDETSTSIAVDNLGNIYETGFFYGTVDFDPGSGVANLTSTGSYDVFVSKLDASGNLVWARSFGGTLGDEGHEVAVDGSGNVYTTGSFESTVDFDPGVGVTNLTSAGLDDVFVSKLDASGSLVWVRSFRGASHDYGRSLAVDGSGNVYTTGTFKGTVDFDPGSGVANLTSTGHYDVFVSKLDVSGSLVWVRSFGGTSTEYVYSLAVDGSGNVYTVGHFGSTVDFDPGVGVTNLTSADFADVFVSKLNGSGSLVWARAFGGAAADFGHSVAVDGLGNVYITGMFSDTVDFDPGAGVFNLTSVGGSDAFVSKLNMSGNLVWARAFGGTANSLPTQGWSIAVDGLGNVYITGMFSDTVDFDPGAGVFNLTSVGLADVFVSKLNVSGNLVWTKSLGGMFDDFGIAIAVDASSSVYVTGVFSGLVDFDPGAGVTHLTSSGGRDVFVMKMNSFGRTVTTQTIAFASVADTSLGAGTVTLSATASSDLAVSFTSATQSVCSVSGNIVTLLTVGVCTINATQAGDPGMSAAPQVSRTFVVLSLPSSGNPGSSTSVPSGNPGSFTTVPAINPAVSTRKPEAARTIASYAKLAVNAGSVVSLKVAGSSKTCRVVGSRLQGLKAGTCRVTVTVKPKNGRSVSRTITLRVAK